MPAPTKSSTLRTLRSGTSQILRSFSSPSAMQLASARRAFITGRSDYELLNRKGNIIETNTVKFCPEGICSFLHNKTWVKVIPNTGIVLSSPDSDLPAYRSHYHYLQKQYGEIK